MLTNGVMLQQQGDGDDRPDKHHGEVPKNPAHQHHADVTKNQHHADVTTSLHGDLHISAAMVKATVTIIIREISNLRIGHYCVVMKLHFVKPKIGRPDERSKYSWSPLQSLIKLFAEGFKRSQTFMKTRQMLWGEINRSVKFTNTTKQGQHVMKSINCW